MQTSDALGAAASQLGPNAQAMIALLKDKVGVSYGDVSTTFSAFFGISLSRGGDALNLPVPQKTGAAVRKQAPVMAENLAAVVEDGEPTARYDGYGS